MCFGAPMRVDVFQFQCVCVCVCVVLPCVPASFNMSQCPSMFQSVLMSVNVLEVLGCSELFQCVSRSFVVFLCLAMCHNMSLACFNAARGFDAFPCACNCLGVLRR